MMPVQVSRGLRPKGARLSERVLRALVASAVMMLVTLAASPSAFATGTRVLAWGSNEAGALGIGNSAGPISCSPSFNKPCSPVPALTMLPANEVIAISAGVGQSLALLKSGVVDAWGSNKYGQLGNDEMTESNTPVEVKGLPKIKAIASGEDFNLALSDEGEVWAWGDNSVGQLGGACLFSSCAEPVEISMPEAVASIAAGNVYALARLKEGTVMAWGDNDEGELGDGTLTSSSFPVEVKGLEGPATEVSAGSFTGYAVLKGGTVSSWGGNDQGALGDGVSQEAEPFSTTPKEVVGLREVSAISGHAGGTTALALLSNHTVDAWGYNYWWELGDGNGIATDEPVLVKNVTGVKAISVGSYSSYALLETGAVVAWGDNEEGQIGNGHVENWPEAPLEVLQEATAISGGGQFVLAIQAASGPQFKSNGEPVESPKQPIFDAGEVTLESHIYGKVRCRVLANGSVWNEHERGYAAIESFLAFPCKGEANPCQGLFVSAEAPGEIYGTHENKIRRTSTVPWVSELYKSKARGEHVSRLMITGVEVILVDPCDGAETFYEGAIDPVVVNGAGNGLDPSRLEFGTEAGHLVEPTLSEGSDALYFTESELAKESSSVRPFKLSGEELQLMTAK